MKIKNRLSWETAGALLPQGSLHTLWLRGVIVLVLPLLLLGVIAATTAGISASSDRFITVCPAGPPECDYQGIQPALNAAAPGDTVLVKPGTYTGQLTLRSQVTLESSDGPGVTIVKATQGPIVTASGVVSASLRGLSLSGEAIATDSLGVDLLDSEVSLSNCIISSLSGKNGDAATPDGETAVAIRSGGMSKLMIDGTTIQDIRGGNGLPRVAGGAAGGSAIGVAVTGSAEVTMAGTVIRQLSGGSAGTYASWPYSCDGTGGRAIAIQSSGDVNLKISNCQIIDVTGGKPCVAGATYCQGRTGAAVGIQATGGTIAVHDTLFARILAQAAYESETNYAIHTALTQGTYLRRNTITSLSASDGSAARELRAAAPSSPFCGPPPGTVIAIASEGDSRFVAADNSLSDLFGTGYYGGAVGILVKDVADAELSRNKVTGVSGGYAGLTASGFRLEQVNAARLDANVLGGIHGAAAPERFYYAYFGDEGGSAAGIQLIEVTSAALANNVIWALSGGRGTDCVSGCVGRNGGDATALVVTGSSAGIWNNSCYQTVAGLGGNGTSQGQAGSAVGMKLVGMGEVIAANNALVKHGTGILSALSTAPVLEHNDLWQNETDYKGVTPGARDLHVAPAFVDPTNGDLHLKADSPLIDAGTSGGIPFVDMDGEPRPLDGNGDGAAIADIGADEYWPGLRGSKTVDKLIATAGDVLTYQVTLANPSIPYGLSSVRVTDTIPSHVTYVQGSLSGSGGVWGYESGVITWIGAVFTAVPVTLTFQVVVDEVAGPLAIVNRAVVDDSVGATRTLQAVTFVDPLRYYFPIVLNKSPLGG